MQDVEGMKALTELEALNTEGGNWSWCGFGVGVVLGQLVLMPVTGGLSGAGLPLTVTATAIACGLGA